MAKLAVTRLHHHSGTGPLTACGGHPGAGPERIRKRIRNWFGIKDGWHSSKLGLVGSIGFDSNWLNLRSPFPTFPSGEIELRLVCHSVKDHASGGHCLEHVGTVIGFDR